MRVLGIDPGLSVTGYGVITFDDGRPALVEGGAIRTSAEDPIPVRLCRIHAEVTAVIREFEPDLVGLEDLFSNYRFPRSALKMAHARGAICLAAAQCDVPVLDLPPATVKNAVAGNGRASKAQVQAAVQQLFGLSQPPTPVDVSDALAVAVAAAYRSQRSDARAQLLKAVR